MKLITCLLASAIVFSSFFLDSKDNTFSSSSAFNCIVDAGEDIQLEFGDSVEVSLQTNCPLNEIASISVSPDDSSISCSNNGSLCFDYRVRPLTDICYTFTVEAIDGCTSTDEICVFLQSCEPLFSDNDIAAISPAQVSDLADVTLEVARTQFVRLEVVNEDEGIQTQVWEGMLTAGERTVSVDFSAVPSGNYNLVGKFYPNDKSISFEKQ